MSRRILTLLLATALLSTTAAEAQFIMRPRPMRYGRRPQRPVRPQLPPVKPSLNVSFGYGFPALDKNYLPEYYNAYQGHISQTGPITGSIDYRFSRVMSIGVMASYNKVSAPYYDYPTDALPAFKANFTNWSIMLNLMHYIPVNGSVTPYFRTAAGVNIWDQQYTSANGTPAHISPVEVPDFAYQVSFGAKFNFSSHAGLFLEAGYGKYIAQGGLSFKF
ncbi:MAG: hypothetical protein QM731_00645 [Chitinophagaceae bacterium]